LILKSLHDVSLVDGSDAVTTNLLGVGESITSDTLRSILGNQLDGLNNAINDFVLNTRVFTLSVFTDKNGVNVLIRGFVTNNRAARTNVGIEVESTTKSQVERNVTFANGGGKRSLQSDGVLADRLNGAIRNSGLTILDDRSDINFLPLDRYLGSREDTPNRGGNLGTDTCISVSKLV
jgi:hypothetical protein